MFCNNPKPNWICCRMHKIWSCELHLRATYSAILFDQLCLEHVLYVNILLAVNSIHNHFCRCFCAMFVGLMRKISQILMTMSLVWWSTRSDSCHILYTGTWLRGDHLGKCWRSSCRCAMVQSRPANVFKFADRQHKRHHYHKLIKYN